MHLARPAFRAAPRCVSTHSEAGIAYGYRFDSFLEHDVAMEEVCIVVVLVIPLEEAVPFVFRDPYRYFRDSVAAPYVRNPRILHIGRGEWNDPVFRLRFWFRLGLVIRLLNRLLRLRYIGISVDLVAA